MQSRCKTVIVKPSAFCKGICVGYLISFFLGVYVATVGISGAAKALDKTVQSAQSYIQANLK